MMKSIPVWKQELSGGVHAARLASLYCCAPAEAAPAAARPPTGPGPGPRHSRPKAA